MPWRERTCMSERSEFVVWALEEGANLSALCRHFGISRKTGYKWLRRYRDEGSAGLADRSRRPRASPRRTTPELEARLCALRKQHPAWGGRKLHHVLRREGVPTTPAPSTITGILNRNGLLDPERRLVRDLQRFEAPAPNALWQMDFKGPVDTDQRRCYPLTVLDDHSRFNVCLAACTDQRAETVQQQLIHTFEQTGLPERMLMDNGSPWGSDWVHPHTKLTAWLIRQGITVLHGRPFHPQTQGKEERFHRTLALELLSRRVDWPSPDELQEAFDGWRDLYNYQRPHEALGHVPPASRYQPSPRPFRSTLPPIEYDRADEVRKVQQKGRISFRGHDVLVSRAFIGEPVALRPVGDGAWDVYYCHQRVGHVDLSS
jgi:transposase InsO family protein